MRLQSALLSLPVLTLSLIDSSAFAQAQTTSADSQSAAATSQSQVNSGIADIVVTAQRRSESLQKVPIAITAVTASQLATSGIRDATDLAIATPSLQANNSIGYFLPRLRGIGSTSTGPGIEGAVASYIDNVYIGAAPAAVFSFNNVERVEVLKGPQGTLFGRNATGGLINVITKDPSHTTGGQIDIGYGNYNTVDGDLYLTTGLSQTAAIDFAATVSHQGDGYGTNLVTGRDANKTDYQFNLRSKLLWNPGDLTEIRLSGDYAESKGNFPGPRDFASTKPLFGPSGGGRPWDENNSTPTSYRFKGGGVTLRIDQQLGGLKLVNIAAYRQSEYTPFFDFDATPTPALAIRQVQKDKQFSEELQLQSDPASAIKWVIGAYYFNAQAKYDPLDLYVLSALQTPTSPFFPLTRTSTRGTQKTDSIAGFAQVTVPLGASTNLTGGIRYTRDERRLVDVSEEGFIIGGASIGSLLPPGTGNQSKTFGQPTWRVSVDHSFSSDVLAYASYNRGFKSGGFNPGTPTEKAYLPEKLDAYEVGIKATLLDRKLRFNPSVFYYDYSNLQVPFVTSGGGFGVVNGSQARVWGAEVEGEAALTSALRVTFGATYLHDRFGNFPNALYYQPSPFGGNTVTTGEARGNRLPFTSDFTTSLGANYTADLHNGQRIVLEGDWSHNDGFYTDSDNLRRQPSYNTVNASLTWSLADGHYTVRAWTKNVTNEAVLVLQTSSAFASYAAYAPPRTFGITLGAKF